MGVVADEVWDEWDSRGREFESINVLVRTNLAPEEAYHRVKAAFDATWPDPQQWPAEIIISPTVYGAGLKLLNCEELTEVLLPMIGQFANAGVSDPRIELYPKRTMALLDAPRPTPFIEWRLAVRATQQSLSRHWQIDERLLEEIYTTAAKWCLELPHDQRTSYIDAGMLCFPVPEQHAAHWLAVAAQALEPLSSVRLVVEGDDGTFRMAVLCPAAAQLSFADGTLTTAQFDWAHSLSALRGLVDEHADKWARSGFVKRGGHWGQVGPTTFARGNWVATPNRITSSKLDQRAIEEDHILDACGILVLDHETARHVPRTWTIDVLGHESVLVQHHDLDAWFAAEHPDEQTLDTARAELRELLPG